MKKTLTLLVSLLLLVGCESIDGALDVFESITLNEGTFAPAHYDAKLRFSSKTKMKLKVSIGEDESQTFTFKLPKGTEIPENGELRLSSEEVDQPYGLAAEIRTDRSRGDSRTDRESCTYRERVHRCRQDDQGRTVCWDDWVTRSGWRYVRFQVQTTVKRVDVSLVAPASSAPAALFDGEDTNRERIYQDIGPCRGF